MSNINIAVYVDMDNIAGVDLNLDKALRSLAKADQANTGRITFKSAYGNQESAKRSLKEQIVAHNFTIVDTPKIGTEKNRADLMMSLDALERLHVDQPRFDRFCFLTSDADFTVIADRLRQYGKEVWLMCKQADKQRPILLNSFDRLLCLEDFQRSPKKTIKPKNKLDTLFIDALQRIGSDKLPVNLSKASNQMRALDSKYGIKGTPYKTFTRLALSMMEKGYVTLEKRAKGEHWITAIHAQH